MNFEAFHFFDLSSFEHASLFSDHGPVWKTLGRIGGYILSKNLKKIEGKVDPGAYLVNLESIYIGPGSVVEAGAYIKGPCYIGSNSIIRHGAYIRGNALIGDRVVIGHATEVKNAIFFNDAHAGHFSYVGDSILGHHVNLGAGAKCANLRFDQKMVTLSYKGAKIDTGLKKFGAILGDHSQLGCNAVTNPGTIMGKSSACFPCMNIGGVIAENHIIKPPLREPGHVI